MAFVNVLIQILNCLDRVTYLDVYMRIVFRGELSVVSDDPSIVDLLVMAVHVEDSFSAPVQ